MNMVSNLTCRVHLELNWTELGRGPSNLGLGANAYEAKDEVDR